MNDLRFALRQLAKSRGFTGVVVLTLALGIGATTAIFTAVNALMLRSLPVKAPGQLVTVVMPMPFIRAGGAEPATWRLYEQFRERARSFSELFAVADARVRPFTAGSSPTDFVQVDHVTGNLFEALGVPAVLGRTLLAFDDRRDDPQAVAVISHAFWQRRFGSDPAIVGQTVRIENASFMIVGVAAAGFFGVTVGSNIDVWCPLHAMPLLDPERIAPDADEWMGLVTGRLRPGVVSEHARVEMDTIFQQDLARKAQGRDLNNLSTRQYFVGRTLELQPAGTGRGLGGGLRAHFQKPLTVLAAAVVVVLLVACANVAGLLLARGAARQREFAVRAALGAGRARLIRQLLGESLLLALLGGALGVLIAQWGTAFLGGYLPEGTALDLSPDRRVLAFALTMTTACGIFCGLVPALRFSRVDLNAAIRTSSDTLAGGGGQAWNRLLVVAQIALSFVLLASADLFVRTLQNLRKLDAGFSRENLLLLTIDPGKAYPGARGAELFQRILERLETLPGVRGATISTGALLLDEGSRARIAVDGYVPGPNEIPSAYCLDVGPRFLATMRLPLLRGRDVTAQDFAANAPRVAIINEAMAHHFFADANPVGKRFKWGRQSLEIVGVTKDVTSLEHVREKPGPAFYEPFVPNDPNEVRSMTFNLRAVGNPPALAGSLRDVVRQLEPRARILKLSTMDAAIDKSLSNQRAIAHLSGFFSIFTVVLASLGLYGLISHGIVRRTREIGVRFALGAQSREVVAMILQGGLGLALLGCALGLAGAIAATRLAGAFLYGVTAADPLTFIATALLLLGVAFVACWLPARRAARIDPMIALRTE